ncbi:LacI family DNA-binding transcriptional regulator [Allosediminivita pacifica]|uniref:LacI family transcriptional regulator n=1 Tax=Allosediminivita pacifica TaxID=1267769 RepID=A0A2T6A6K2_9RHOB|nr:LacI family DNA-binding transcriptional regulator [Allosediminivita pacifica]PTX39416.1 LacI family transcriptional regulator [Allosediminivita pacifica]GGB27853.1 LacI family transcriptional regulator [Allosediminivita pacifica]
MTEKIRETGERVTIRTVAEDAGVSTAAVSKVLRNAYGVSDTLRSKVLTSIEKLGYRPSTAARGMRGKTYSIGLLLTEMENAFLPKVVRGAKEVFGAANYQVMIGVGEAQASIEQSLIDSMMDMRMDGVLLVAPRLTGTVLAGYAAKTPLVVIGHHEPSAETFDTVNSDDVAGAREAVCALIASGYRDIHMTSLSQRRFDMPAGEGEVFTMRETGYLAAMQEAGLSDRARIWRLREREGCEGPPLTDLLKVGPRPEAVFCWSDIHALELINLAWSRGVRVPEDLAIVGYDDTPAAGMPIVGLSSVNQQGADLGRQAARAMLSRIEGRTTPEHILLEPALKTRRSSGS